MYGVLRGLECLSICAASIKCVPELSPLLCYDSPSSRHAVEHIESSYWLILHIWAGVREESTTMCGHAERQRTHNCKNTS